MALRSGIWLRVHHALQLGLHLQLLVQAGRHLAQGTRQPPSGKREVKFSARALALGNGGR